MPRRCILHVGAEKTGSTSIQSFLAMNRQALAAQGWYVPVALLPKGSLVCNHILLTVIGRAQSPNRDELDHLAGCSRSRSVEEVVRAARVGLEQELATNAPASETLLLSNEHIHSRLQTVAQLSELRSFLSHYCDEISVVVYLRAQHEMVRALTNTALRNGLSVPSGMPTFSGRHGLDTGLWVTTSYFDFDALLERLATVFGVSNLDVRLYPEPTVPGSDVVEDFFVRSGIDISRMERPARENTSFDADATGFLNLFNRCIQESRAAADETGQDSSDPDGATPAGPNRRVFEETLRASLQDFMVASRGGRGVPPDRADVAHFLSRFEAGNERVRARWFPQRERLFDIDLEAHPTARAPELTASETMRTFIDFGVWLARSNSRGAPRR